MRPSYLGGESPQNTVRLLQLRGLTETELLGLWAMGLLLGAQREAAAVGWLERLESSGLEFEPGCGVFFSYRFIIKNLKCTAQLKALCSDAGTILSGFNHYCFTVLSFFTPICLAAPVLVACKLFDPRGGMWDHAGLELWHVGSRFLTGHQTWAPELAALSLSHWTTREVPRFTILA